MKRTLVIMLALLATRASAQGIFKRLEFGVKAGGNVTNFTNAAFPTDPLYGFHAGVTMAFKITDRILIQEDILFSSQGAKIQGGQLGNQNLKLSYISVPFLLKYHAASGLFIEAGPQFSIKAGEKIADWNKNDFAKKTDLAATGGIGYQSPLGIGVSARYVYGLSKVGDFSVSGVNNDFKNNAIQASIFYVF